MCELAGRILAVAAHECAANGLSTSQKPKACSENALREKEPDVAVVRYVGLQFVERRSHPGSSYLASFLACPCFLSRHHSKQTSMSYDGSRAKHIRRLIPIHIKEWKGVAFYRLSFVLATRTPSWLSPEARAAPLWNAQSGKKGRCNSLR